MSCVQKNADFEDRAVWYQELSYTWQRIYSCCEYEHCDRAFMWGCMLQQELNVIQEEFGLDKMDLMGSFRSGDLLLFKEKAEELENYIVGVIRTNGVEIDSYRDIDDFLEHNS